MRSSSDVGTWSLWGYALTAVLVLCVLSRSGAQQNGAEGSPGVGRTLLDLSYSAADPQVCRLDVFLPAGPGNGCCIFFVHGGGWAGGNKESWHPVMEHFRALGYVCTSADYHLLPDRRFPSQLEDVRLAMAWVKSRAGEYGFDPGKVAVLGSSAGGHLAAMLATTQAEDDLGVTDELTSRDTLPAAAVCLCSVLSCHHYADAHAGVAKMLDRFLGPGADDPEVVRSASPIDRVRGKEPPFLMVVGDADETTPVSLHEAMRDRLVEKGVGAELVVLEGVKHGFGYGVKSSAQKETLGHIERFLAAVFGLE